MKQNQDTPLAKRTVFVLAVSVLLLWLGLGVTITFFKGHTPCTASTLLDYALTQALVWKPADWDANCI
jgi:hypothetical protein